MAVGAEGGEGGGGDELDVVAREVPVGVGDGEVADGGDGGGDGGLGGGEAVGGVGGGADEGAEGAGENDGWGEGGWGQRCGLQEEIWTVWVTVEGSRGVREAARKGYVQRDVPGMLYQPGGEGGRGLSPGVSTLMMFVKPTAGFAGMLIEKACGMRAVRPRRKKSVEDITVDGK